MLPLIVPLSSFLFIKYIEWIEDFKVAYSSVQIEEEWRNKAIDLHEKNSEGIERTFREFQEKYPEGSMFWVDSQGKTNLQIPEKQNIPQEWSASDAVAFMKRSFEGDHLQLYLTLEKRNKGRLWYFKFRGNM